jgi:hypothetical protein
MNEDVLALFIPIIAIVMSFTVPMVFAWIDYRRRRDIVDAHHRERLAAIERGMEIPPLPEAFYSPFRKRRSSYLLPGMIWAFVGTGLFIALGAVAGEDVRYFALIPIGVGAAYLIYHVVEGRKLPPDRPAAG